MFLIGEPVSTSPEHALVVPVMVKAEQKLLQDGSLWLTLCHFGLLPRFFAAPLRPF